TATDGITASTSPISVSPAAASKLAFPTAAQPASTTAGSTMAPFSVQVEDAFGNSIAQSGTAITLTLNGSTIASGTNPQTTDSTGKATFNNIVINQAGNNLTFTANGGG